jgi:hypothetical protein
VPGAAEIKSSEQDRWEPLLVSLESGLWVFWVDDKLITYVPTPIIRHQSAVPHCEDGPAFESLDWREWFIDGILVDEQIVMRPATQTVSQIDADDNSDRRSIRVQRFGWPRYLAEVGAVLVDERRNDVEGTIEKLVRTNRGEQRLLVTCPTKRIFALGCPGDVRTCDQAQRWLGGPRPMNVIART